jgi:cell division protein FtsQ
MRFVPNRLIIQIHERTPVAFARVGPRISLIDAGGVLMELPLKHKYSFPVILGMNPGEPLSTRLPRMKAYNELVQDLDSGGARYSQDLSEVDIQDLDNLKVRVNDPAGDVLVELGSSDYLKRYKIFVSHAREWRQQFQKLESVNLRYDNQVIVNPDVEGKPKQASLTPAAVKAAAAAGVKPAALLNRVGPHERPLPKPVFALNDKSAETGPTANKSAAVVRKKPSKPVKVAAKRDWRKHAAPAAKGKTVSGHAASTKNDVKTPARAVAQVSTPKPSPAVTKQGAGSN